MGGEQAWARLGGRDHEELGTDVSLIPLLPTERGFRHLHIVLHELPEVRTEKHPVGPRLCPTS